MALDGWEPPAPYLQEDKGRMCGRGTCISIEMEMDHLGRFDRNRSPGGHADPRDRGLLPMYPDTRLKRG